MTPAGAPTAGVTPGTRAVEPARPAPKLYVVHWFLATNGFGYRLATWGPPEFRTELKEEAGRMVSNFELIAIED